MIPKYKRTKTWRHCVEAASAARHGQSLYPPEHVCSEPGCDRPAVAVTGLCPGCRRKRNRDRATGGGTE